MVEDACDDDEHDEHDQRPDRLYKKERLLWRAFPRLLTRTSPRRSVSKFRKWDQMSKEPAKDLVHASVDCRGSIVTKVATESIPTPSIAGQRTSTFEEIWQNRHDGFSWAIAEVTVANNAKVLASALVRGKAIPVSNGSFKNSQGTAGFVIEGDNRSGRLVRVNVIPGKSECQSSYWSEIGGVAGILESLHCVSEAHGILSGAIEIGLDGEQAMKAVADTWPIDLGNPDYNLLQQVRGQITALPLTITFRWIASHQDKHKTLSQLDR
jgi:hypothetical protein